MRKRYQIHKSGSRSEPYIFKYKYWFWPWWFNAKHTYDTLEDAQKAAVAHHAGSFIKEVVICKAPKELLVEKVLFK